jgi:hypothetical protein
LPPAVCRKYFSIRQQQQATDLSAGMERWQLMSQGQPKTPNFATWHKPERPAFTITLRPLPGPWPPVTVRLRRFLKAAKRA